MEERVQKLLSAAGVCSRRTAETYITAGRVSINGETAQLGQRADPDRDDIRLDGQPLGRKAAPLYLLLNKPRGYVTTLSDEKGRKTVADLVSDCGARVYPVGRLDLDSEGLLLLTNDGALMQHLLHPRHQVEKTYHVTVFGDIRDAAARLAAVTDLDGEPICPARVQIRRMCAQCGWKVQRLRRVQEHTLELGDLPAGAWRYLTEDEVAALREA